MDKKRLLITGGSSYLGQHLVPLALAEYDVCYSFYENDPLNLGVGVQVDFREETAVLELVRAFKPAIIIHTAGSNRSRDMERVIVEGTQHVKQAATEVAARLVHISTDVVFDGTKGPYCEDDEVSPIHAYGQAKVAAEEIVAGYDNYVIVRTSLIYGLRLMDRGTAWMVGSLQTGKAVTLFDNQYRNPIWVNTLSQACLELGELSFQGILHVAGEQSMSRAMFGLKMLDWWHVQEREQLRIGPDLSGRWPLDCQLDVSQARGLLTTPLWGVDKVLAVVGKEH